MFIEKPKNLTYFGVFLCATLSVLRRYILVISFIDIYTHIYADMYVCAL